jgi:flagellar biosynthesis/type III secretory pathway chaperone
MSDVVHATRVQKPRTGAACTTLEKAAMRTDTGTDNANANAFDWEQELANLLGDLMGIQSELLEVLTAKREAVGRNDLQGVEEMRPRAEKLLERLQTCHDRRAQLLQLAARQGLPATSLTKLATQATPNRRNKLGKQVKESVARMRLLQQQSLANWVLAQRSLLHISQMLEIIATGGRLVPTYGRGEPTLTGGALVDQEA